MLDVYFSHFLPLAWKELKYEVFVGSIFQQFFYTGDGIGDGAGAYLPGLQNQGSLLYFTLKNAKSRSSHQKIFIYSSYEYLGQYLPENTYLIESIFFLG